jgi:hypothetical protein
MEGSHEREYGEHLGGEVRGSPPVLSAEGDLGDLLPSAEAIVHGAPAKALRAKLRMDAAAEVGSQMGARLACLLREREVGGDGEGRRDAAQGEAVRAVSA